MEKILNIYRIIISLVDNLFNEKKSEYPPGYDLRHHKESIVFIRDLKITFK